MPKNKENAMRFSTWDYTRPDYAEVRGKINHCKNRMQNAMSYQVFRDAWLDVKKEIEYIIFIICAESIINIVWRKWKYKTRRSLQCMLCAMHVTGWRWIQGIAASWNRNSLEDIHRGTCWPRQTHIVESPFYYIQYDIAQISTYEFYLKMKSSYEHAWSDYMRLCSEGGSKSYLELLETAHLSNPFFGNTLEEIFQPIVEELYGLL